MPGVMLNHGPAPIYSNPYSYGPLHKNDGSL